MKNYRKCRNFPCIKMTYLVFEHSFEPFWNHFAFVTSSMNASLAETAFPIEWVVTIGAIILVHLLVSILHEIEKLYMKIIAFGALFFESSREHADRRNVLLLQEILVLPHSGHSGKDIKCNNDTHEWYLNKKYVHHNSQFLVNMKR